MGKTIPHSMDKIQTLILRQRIIKSIREFFEVQDFLEVQTPLLVPNPGLEPHLEYFETEFVPGLDSNQCKQKLFLPTSPEYHLKRALGEFNLPRIFEITRSFRNGETSRKHEPEFFILEWYRSPGTYKDISRDLENLFSKLGEEFTAESLWHKPQHISVCEAFDRFVGVDLLKIIREDPSGLAAKAKAASQSTVSPNESFETAFHFLIVEKIEPQLGFRGPEFLWDYPREFAALARQKPGQPELAERFEVYWRGIELANAFGELTSSKEQRSRCILDQKERLARYGKTPDLDEKFLLSLDRLPTEVGGIAVGLDRLIQVLLGKPSLQDVIAFPHCPSV